MSVTNWYTDASAGSDNNGGSSEGSAIVSGAAGETDGTAVVDLTGDTPDLSGVSVGDTIRINGEAGGINSTDVFEITGVNDGADTVDVTPTPGTDTGLTWAIGGAFATIQRALNVVTKADGTIYVKSGTSYNEELTTDAQAVGDSTNWITIEGYTTSPGDDGIATNDGTTGDLTNGWVGINGSNYTIFKNLRFTKFDKVGLGDVNADFVHLISVRSDNNGNDAGAAGIQLNDNCKVHNCYVHDNLNADGITISGGCTITNCIVHDNVNHGIDLDFGTVYGCLLWNNGESNIQMSLANSFQIVIGCTIDGEGSSTHGIYFEPANANTRCICINNIVINCTTGIEGGPVSKQHRVSYGNLLHGNGTPYTNFGTDYLEVTSDPSFVNEGTDYTPSYNSAADGAGADLATNVWSVPVTGSQRSIGAIEINTDTGSGGSGGMNRIFRGDL